MLERYKPDLCLQDLYSLDFEILRNKGIKGLILDIDNTIVPPHARDIGSKALQWIKKAGSEGFRLLILSNASRHRVDRFFDGTDIEAISRAGKPAVSAFIAAKTKLGLESENIAVFGDQLFTDIAGGNRAGMFTVLVKPIDERRDWIFIRFKRLLEKIVMFFWERGSM